jgi:hypothetical protein
MAKFFDRTKAGERRADDNDVVHPAGIVSLRG